jgi:hypothetical protein
MIELRDRFKALWHKALQYSTLPQIQFTQTLLLLKLKLLYNHWL